jgi:hypothetical protein
LMMPSSFLKAQRCSQLMEPGRCTRLRTSTRLLNGISECRQAVSKSGVLVSKTRPNNWTQKPSGRSWKSRSEHRSWFEPLISTQKGCCLILSQQYRKSKATGKIPSGLQSTRSLERRSTPELTHRLC